MNDLAIRGLAAETDGIKRSVAYRVKVAIAVIIGAALMFAVAEALLRLAISNAFLSPPVFQSTTEPVGYKLLPNVAATVRHVGREVVVSTDSHGNRTTPAPIQLAASAPTVHLVGDSQIFGWGLSDSETIAARIQEQFGGTVRVVNHGVPGYGPVQYREVLKNIPKADYVVVAFTEENDAADTYQIGRFTDVSCTFIASFSREGVVRCALMRSRLVQGAFSGVNGFTHQYHMTPLGFSDHSIVAGRICHFRVSEYIRAESAERDGKLLTTVIPWKGRYSAAWRERYAPPPMSETRDLSTPFPESLKTIAAFSQHQNSELLYLDGDTHLSPDGANLLAGEIVHGLQSIISTTSKETK